MEQEILNRLDTQDQILQQIHASTEKTRKYFLWTFYVTLAFFVLPLVGLMFIIPAFLSSITSSYAGII